MIEVFKQQGYTFVRKDGLTQSIIPAPPASYWLQLLPEMIPAPQDVLILGLGGGTCVFEVAGRWPDCRIWAVENDPEMLNLLEFFTKLKNCLKEVFQADAFQFVEKHPGKYDLVIVDLFDGFKFDLRCVGEKFLNECKELVRHGGTLTVNTPDMKQCEQHFNGVAGDDFNKIYHFNKSVELVS